MRKGVDSKGALFNNGSAVMMNLTNSPSKLLNINLNSATADDFDRSLTDGLSALGGSITNNNTINNNSSINVKLGGINNNNNNQKHTN